MIVICIPLNTTGSLQNEVRIRVRFRVRFRVRVRVRVGLVRVKTKIPLNMQQLTKL